MKGHRSRRAPARIQRQTPLRAKPAKEGIRLQHKAFIRLLPCVACGGPPPCHAAHVRMSRADLGKFNAMSAKPDDKYCVPLHEKCHLVDQHSKEGEPAFWARLGIDPLDLSLRLWAVSGNLEEGQRAVFRARQAIALHQRGP